jgi:hypothetical protein
VSWPTAGRCIACPPRYKPAEPPAEPTFTLAFRDGEHQVRFTLINSATARLLNLFQDTPGLTGAQAISRLEEEMSLPTEALRDHGAAELLADLRASGRHPRHPGSDFSSRGSFFAPIWCNFSAVGDTRPTR